MLLFHNNTAADISAVKPYSSRPVFASRQNNTAYRLGHTHNFQDSRQIMTSQFPGIVDYVFWTRGYHRDFHGGLEEVKNVYLGLSKVHGHFCPLQSSIIERCPDNNFFANFKPHSCDK